MDTGPTANSILRDVVIVSGEDAVTYLHTQLSQDIVGLSVGDSAWSYILAPKSEIQALVRVTRRDADTVILDVGVGHGAAVRKRLDRMLFRMDVTFEEARWPGIGWRGKGATIVATDSPIAAAYPASFPDAFDEVGPDVVPPEDIPALADADFESLRILAGWPAEPEFNESATPVMTGIVADTVSFEKGCYTGQEFVARVHYRDSDPPRRLVRLSFPTDGSVDVGSSLSIDGEDIGSATSVVPSRGLGLGYLKRSIPTPTIASVGATTVSVADVRAIHDSEDAG